MKTLRLLALCLLAATPLFADSGLALQPGDSIASVLKRQIGQKIELRLNSGEKIAGKLESVGDNAVSISNLVGQELFEAVVAINEISAVVARIPTK
jgi:hypothetical protein